MVQRRVKSFFPQEPKVSPGRLMRKVGTGSTDAVRKPRQRLPGGDREEGLPGVGLRAAWVLPQRPVA